MRLRSRFLFLLFALVAASTLILAAACGGGDDDEGEPSGGDGSPAATETAEVPDETEEPADDEDENGDGGEAPDIAAPPGATETFSGTFTGGNLPFGGFPGDSPLDPGEYSEVQYALYETDDSVDDVVDFYKDEFQGWEEEFTFGGDSDGEAFKMIVWSKDDGNVGAWIMATEGDGTTDVIVVTGAQ